jgi:thiamine biosynthesis lipoprotein
MFDFSSGSLKFESIGSKWSIDFGEKTDQEKISKIKKIIFDRIEKFDSVYSRFRKDSLVTKMSILGGEYILSDDGRVMMDMYKKLYSISSGEITPLIGSVLVEAGYDSNYSLKGRAETKVLKWEDVIEYDFPKIKLKEPALLDFGALGKGYLVDIIADILINNKFNYFSIDAGGDILHRGKDGEKIIVGLENPINFEQVIGKVPIFNKSICASSGNRRRWGEYHHIISPDSLKSPDNILSTWVIADSTILADALATSLFFVKPETLGKNFDFEFGILYPDFSFKQSSGFNADIFTN